MGPLPDLKLLKPLNCHGCVSSRTEACFRRIPYSAYRLHIPLLHLLRNVLRRPPGERHNGERRILVSVGAERRAVGDEQGLRVPSLAIGIEHRSPPVVAHTRGADLVDDLASL